MKNSNIFKKTISAFAVVLCVTLLTPGVAQAKSQIALNKAKVTMCTGKTYTLKMSGISKKVKWSTSDKNVVSIKTSGKNKVNCKITAKNKGTATVAAKVKVGKKTKTFQCQVKVAGHKYSKVSYKWNKGYSKCTASKKCTRCGKTLKQTVKTTNKTTTKATCTETGKKKYTAQFTKYDFGTKTKSVTIKAKGHKVNSNKKISYKWNNGYSKCTATYYCKNGGEKQKETVNTSEKTTPATKTSKGKTVYTANFKTKGLETQTKTRVIPKLAYLTLNGKEVNSVTIDYAHPAKITIANVDSDVKIEGITPEEKINQTNFYMDSTFAQSWWNNDPDWRDYSDENVNLSDFRMKINKAQTSATFQAIPPASDKTYNIQIYLSNGYTANLKLTTKFTPGEYNFGEVNNLPTGGYRGYGKQKGTYGDEEFYIMDCDTKAQYDEAYRFYHHQTRRDGVTVCDLSQKSQEIEAACSQRANYKSKARIEWEALSYDVQESTYDGDFYKYVKDKYGDVGMAYHSAFGKGFADRITSNAQLNEIVSEWTKVSGEVPSWYYYTAFSDWAEWVGRDVGKYTHTAYDEAIDKIYSYTPPALPDNFRD